MARAKIGSLYRRFGGEDFALLGDFETKAEAKAFAVIARARGYRARVVPVPKGVLVYWGRKTFKWSVYGRRK